MTCESFKIINNLSSPEYINGPRESRCSSGLYNQVLAKVRGSPGMKKSSKRAAGCRIILLVS